MNWRGWVKGAAIVAAAALLGGAAGTRSTRADWDSVVVETELGHRIGNPDAKVKLIEFLSYTCPHCAEFAQQGDAPIKLAYVIPGKVSVEIRHLVRDPVDLTVGMLVNCGATAKFPANHNAFILAQDRWIAPLGRASGAQRARWTTAGAAGRRAIASDFGFYAIMERRGYRRTDVDRCLADEAMATRLAETSAKEWDRPGVDATPTFAINGIVMPGTHTWPSLERQLKEFL
jgi:protein-disulfide isomerase